MDIGILVTGIAAAIAFLQGRGLWLRHVLMLSWLVIGLETFAVLNMATVVFTMVMLDFIIAGTALVIVTHDPNRIDAKVVGGISMALMPAHWIVSITHGNVDWFLYASACNAAFVLQCLVVRGWLDGVGRSVDRFFNRFVRVSFFRRGQ